MFAMLFKQAPFTCLQFDGCLALGGFWNGLEMARLALLLKGSGGVHAAIYRKCGTSFNQSVLYLSPSVFQPLYVVGQQISVAQCVASLQLSTFAFGPRPLGRDTFSGSFTSLASVPFT